MKVSKQQIYIMMAYKASCAFKGKQAIICRYSSTILITDFKNCE